MNNECTMEEMDGKSNCGKERKSEGNAMSKA